MSLSPLQFDAAKRLLRSGGRPVLWLADGWQIEADEAGAFLRFAAAEPASFVVQALGRLAGLHRFTSLQRASAYWARPATGRSEAEVRPETLWLLAETGPRRFTLVVPLLDSPSRFALAGNAEGLEIVGETGDPGIACAGGLAAFVASGDDPYELCAAAAGAAQRRLGLGRLRVDKPLPDTIDLFGWCTWDAFYKAVSEEQVLAGLEAFERAGVSPRLLILDDGWQQWQRGAGGEDRLTSLAANERFGFDLGRLSRTVRERYGIERFLVWHALLGYWGGLDDEAFARFGSRSVARAFGPGLLAQDPRWNVWPWGAQVGVPAIDRLADFFDEFHATLAAQGVDGVKVDNQAALEAVSAGQGGRVEFALAARRALEDSVRRHFDGRLINCMSCTPECAYLSNESLLMRSSDDFFPQRPETHGPHLHANALVGVWFGEFMQPDWDMFHSHHPRAAFHAAARAVSGGPIYVSDGIGTHDAALLRKLVLSDGTVLRADLPGRPTPDCLLADPTREPLLLKVFNRNGDCGLVGLFHAGGRAGPLAARVGPRDVPGLEVGRAFVAWAHRHDRLWHCTEPALGEFTLDEGGSGADWELVTLAPVEHGVAVIGLADKFNSAGAISARSWHGSDCHFELRDGGALLAWCECPPRGLLCDGVPLPFTHDAESGRLSAAVPAGASRRIIILAA